MLPDGHVRLEANLRGAVVDESLQLFAFGTVAAPCIAGWQGGSEGLGDPRTEYAGEVSGYHDLEKRRKGLRGDELSMLPQDGLQLGCKGNENLLQPRLSPVFVGEELEKVVEKCNAEVCVTDSEAQLDQLANAVGLCIRHLGVRQRLTPACMPIPWR